MVEAAGLIICVINLFDDHETVMLTVAFHFITIMQEQKHIGDIGVKKLSPQSCLGA